MADAIGWLPTEWDPDQFDLDEINSALAAATAEPVQVSGELAALAADLERQGVTRLREVLGRPVSHGPTDVPVAAAARLTESFRVLVDLLGDGVKLTSAGYLPPSLVQPLAERTGITAWWIGKANREDLTPPVVSIRDTARELGLVGMRKGVLSPTAAARRTSGDPSALLDHIISRLPLGKGDFERDSGWLALAVAASGAPVDRWRSEVGDLLGLVGWRNRNDLNGRVSGHSPTLQVLQLLAGSSRDHRMSGVDPDVAAVARAVIRRG